MPVPAQRRVVGALFGPVLAPVAGHAGPTDPYRVALRPNYADAEA